MCCGAILYNNAPVAHALPAIENLCVCSVAGRLIRWQLISVGSGVAALLHEEDMLFLK
jgi:hypothetical protein